MSPSSLVVFCALWLLCDRSMYLNDTGTVLVTCAQDKQMIIWKGSSVTTLAKAYSCHMLNASKQGSSSKHIKIVASLLHPCQRYAFSFGEDGQYHVKDLDNFNDAFISVRPMPNFSETKMEAASIHVDGLLVAFASESHTKIIIWELSGDALAVELNVPAYLRADSADAPTRVHSLNFSENGFHLALATTKGVCVYDLRKQKTSSDKVFSADYNTLSATDCTAAKFDSSGKVLAVAYSQAGKPQSPRKKNKSRSNKSAKLGCSVLRLYMYGKGKTFEMIKEFEVGEEITDICFGPDSKTLCYATTQRAVNVLKG